MRSQISDFKSPSTSYPEHEDIRLRKATICPTEAISTLERGLSPVLGGTRQTRWSSIASQSLARAEVMVRCYTYTMLAYGSLNIATVISAVSLHAD